MQKFLIAALSVSLFVPTAVLAEGALAPGKPAGVRSAQMDRTSVFVGLGAVAVLVGVAVAASDCCQSRNTPVPIAAAPTTTV
ncbi:MAG: hypothetical protein V4601_00300 [Pseudomonadota bacterium]